MSVTFDAPKSGSFEIPDNVGPGRFLGKMHHIEDAGMGDFGRQVDWYWELAVNQLDEQGRPDPAKMVPAATNADGTPFLLRDRTGAKFGKNPKSGVTAAARIRAEALLRKELTDDEARGVAANPDQLVDKVAILHLVFRTSTDSQRQFLNVAHVEPYRKGAICTGYLPDDDGSTPGEDDAAPF